jgi:hypothetical protein
MHSTVALQQLLTAGRRDINEAWIFAIFYPDPGSSQFVDGSRVLSSAVL